MRIASAPDGTIHIDGKVVTGLDRFVASVTEIIERYTRYVIISGYVAILFGGARVRKISISSSTTWIVIRSGRFPKTFWNKGSIS